MKIILAKVFCISQVNVLPHDTSVLPNMAWICSQERSCICNGICSGYSATVSIEGNYNYSSPGFSSNRCKIGNSVKLHGSNNFWAKEVILIGRIGQFACV